jgi:DNA-binding CsgD family transcriptional regulator
VVLYDATGHLLYLSAAHEPYSLASFLGKPAWHYLNAHDAEHCQAAFFRALTTKREVTFDVELPGSGFWRTTLYPCRVGRVRLVAVSEKFPAELLRLTAREQVICRLLAAGKSSKEIAVTLGIARSTVDNLRANAARRLGIKAGQLVAWAAAHRDWLK